MVNCVMYESQTHASRLFIDFLSQTFIEGLTGISAGCTYLSAFLEMMNVQTAGGPTLSICTCLILSISIGPAYLVRLTCETDTDKSLPVF